MGNPLSPILTVDGVMFLKIDHSVGKGGSNRQDDVRTIQLLLNIIHLDPRSEFQMPALLAMDGICGPKTLAAILAYQNYKMNSAMFLVAADGLVTATHHMFLAGKGPRLFGHSTLQALNFDFMMALPRTNLALLNAYAFEPFFSTVILPLQKAGVI